MKLMNTLIDSLMSDGKYDIIREITHKGIIISDREGVIIEVDDSFSLDYGLTNTPILNRSVYDLEKHGIFSPSATRIALETKKKQTITQTVSGDKRVVVTAIPLLDEVGDVSFIITFSRDLDEYLELKPLFSETAKQSTDVPYLVESFKTYNPSFQTELSALEKVSPFNISILLKGETGVGKSLLAEKIHSESNDSEGQFVAINCGAIPHELLESELFGYKKGAFTGANQDKPGLIEMANGGTLFLDEITELPLQAQVKLLTVLQSKKIRRIGDIKERHLNFRLISATNRTLEESLNQGKLREDLLYRINAFTLEIPPLRKRREDIHYLAQFYLDYFNQQYHLTRSLTEAVLQRLITYPWLGNIRELENVIHRLVITAHDNQITLSDCSGLMEMETQYQGRDRLSAANNKGEQSNIDEVEDLNGALHQYEKAIITHFYQKYRSSTKVAKKLNISQSTASRKIHLHIHS